MKTWLLLSGAAVAASLLASASSAQQVSANLSLYDTSETTTIRGPGVSVDAITSAENIQLSSDSTGIQTFYGFCVDTMHQIGKSVTDLSYEEEPLATDTFGTPGGAVLSTTQVEQIGALADYGVGLISNPSTSDLAGQLAGVQVAIWDIEYPATTGFTFSPDSSAVDAYVTADIAYATVNALPTTDGITAIIPTNGETQAFVLGSSSPGTLGGGAGAPEPASWALMIVGLGAAGGVLRRRRPVCRSMAV